MFPESRSRHQILFPFGICYLVNSSGNTTDVETNPFSIFDRLLDWCTKAKQYSDKYLFKSFSKTLAFRKDLKQQK